MMCLNPEKHGPEWVVTTTQAVGTFGPWTNAVTRNYHCLTCGLTWSERVGTGW